MITPDWMKEAPLYISRASRKRLNGVYDAMKIHGIDAYYVSWGSNIEQWKIEVLLQGKYCLTCREYISLCTLLGWDIRRDVNYVWYHCVYDPADMARRLRRLNITSCSNLCVEYIQPLRHMFDCFYGQYPKTPRELWGYLWFIRKYEQPRGYSDKIDIED